MTTEGQFRYTEHRRLIVLLSAALLLVNCITLGEVWAAGEREAGNSLELQRYRVWTLRNITGQRGRDYLAQAGVGTVSQLPGTNTLLVTGTPFELAAAGTILGLVDDRQRYVMEVIVPPVGMGTSVPVHELAAEVQDVSVGTFTAPPTADAAAKAVIDIHNERLVIVAEPAHIEKLVSAVETIARRKAVNGPTGLGRTLMLPPKTEPTQEQPQRPVSPTAEQNGNDELFGRLLKTLDEAERDAAARQRRARAARERAAVTAPAVPEAEMNTTEALEQAERKQDGRKVEPVMPERPDVAVEPAEELEPDVQQHPRPIRSYEPEPVEIGDAKLELNMPEKLNIIDLIDLIGKYLNLDYMYDPAQVKGQVSLKLQGPMTVKELYPLLESVLRFRNLVMSRKGNLVTIVPSDKALEIDPVLLSDEDGHIRYGDVVITRIFELEHIDTGSAKNLLNGMKCAAKVMEIAGSGTLIVTDYAYRMARVEELIRMVDKPGEPKQFRFRQLRYTMAKNLAPKIESLAEQLGTVSISIGAAAPAKKKPTKRGRRSRKPTSTKKPAAGKGRKQTVYLDVDERTNRILMIGQEVQLEVVEQLIDSLDVAQQDLRALRLYEIQYVGAEEVKKKLEELGIIGSKREAGPAGRKRATARSAKKGQKKPATASGRAGAPDMLAEEPQVVIIEATNSLLVNATAEQHAEVAMIIAYVDQETLEMAIPYEIYSLENQDPEDLAEILGKLIQETIKDKEGKIERTVKKLEEDIVIVPDKGTFSLIVYANRKNQEWIKKLIHTLDRRRPQVLINATLVAIEREDLFNLDLQMATTFARERNTQVVGSISTLPFSGSAIAEAISKPVASLVKGFYGDKNIQVLLTAMQKKKYGRILAQPKILVNDNETGSIKAENTTYVSRSASTAVVAGEATISTSVTFDEFTSGVVLDITPHISEGDLLRLEINLNRSKQESASEGLANTPPPDKTVNEINTIVTVPDNSTIILGGVVSLDQSKSVNKVPLLGDIPIIGGLFRSIDDKDRETKLYIFVKANILRPSETEPGLPQLEAISKRNRRAFEEQERMFQKVDDWPGVEPEPWQPLKILEQD